MWASPVCLETTVAPVKQVQYFRLEPAATRIMILERMPNVSTRRPV